MVKKPTYEELEQRIRDFEADKAEQKKMEKALRQSESRLKQAQHVAQIGFWDMDVETGGGFWSDELFQLLGYQPDEKVPSYSLFREHVHPGDIEKFDESFKKFTNNLKHVNETFRFITTNGDIRFAHSVGSIKFNEDGNALKAFGTFQDITERKLSEEALRESESQISSIFRSVPVGIGSVVNRVLIKVNSRLCEMIGYDEKELIGQSSRMLYTSDEDFAFVGREKYAQIADHGTGMVETRWQKKDGTIMDVLLSSTPVNLKDHSKGVTFTALDITESKQAQETLKSNYALLQIAGETAIFGGWSVDLENNICTWSDAVTIIHDVPRGYAPPVQEGINFYAPEWREKITQCFSACSKDGIPYDEEMEIITQKGKRVWVRTTAKALKNTKGRIIKVQGSFQDITERKLAEESKKKYEKELEERNLFIQTVLDNLPIGLAVNYINEGKATYINKKFEEIYGWPKHLLENIEQFFVRVYPDPEYRKKITRRIFEDIKSGDPKRMVWDGIEITRNDGEKRIVSAKNIALHEQNFMISTVQDITENRKLQAQLTQAQKMESVGRLAGGVAHDFNNMLGVILGHTELALLQADEKHDLYVDLKEIQKAAKRSADITKQLLAFARKQNISPKQIDLNDTVENMLNMLRRLIGEDIDLVWQPSAHLWSVKMDPTQIDQILANLCINAGDAISGVGKLTIETGRKTFDEEYCKQNAGFIPGDFVLLAVSDNGCGMDKDALVNLFEPFFTTKEVGKGTGLGLATVYGIVKQNNGFINVYSEPDQGSTFKIYLPRLVEDEEADKAVPEKKAAACGTETILLVEDETSILRMTRMMLERESYSVLSAATPAEAIEKAKNHSGAIDLLMTDVVMPEMNGRDLAKQITAIYPDIRLLFMSGYTSNVIAHQGVLDDGVAFIQKPFSMADMTGKVREVLDTAPDKN